jgi:uncharacterized RDD family membrane protein YckC
MCLLALRRLAAVWRYSCRGLPLSALSSQSQATALSNRHGLASLCGAWCWHLYFTFFWHKGQTLAMKTWHLKITTLDGLALPQKQALLRYVFAWIWFVPPLASGHLIRPIRHSSFGGGGSVGRLLGFGQ